MGLCTVAGGIWLGWRGLEAWRTGIPLPGNARYNLPMEGWEAVPIAVLLIFFGLCLIGVGLGYIKLKGQSPEPSKPKPGPKGE